MKTGEGCAGDGEGMGGERGQRRRGPSPVGSAQMAGERRVSIRRQASAPRSTAQTTSGRLPLRYGELHFRRTADESALCGARLNGDSRSLEAGAEIVLQGAFACSSCFFELMRERFRLDPVNETTYDGRGHKFLYGHGTLGDWQ